MQRLKTLHVLIRQQVVRLGSFNVERFMAMKNIVLSTEEEK